MSLSKRLTSIFGSLANRLNPPKPQPVEKFPFDANAILCLRVQDTQAEIWVEDAQGKYARNKTSIVVSKVQEFFEINKIGYYSNYSVDDVIYRDKPVSFFSIDIKTIQRDIYKGIKNFESQDLRNAIESLRSNSKDLSRITNAKELKALEKISLNEGYSLCLHEQEDRFDVWVENSHGDISSMKTRMARRLIRWNLSQAGRYPKVEDHFEETPPKPSKFLKESKENRRPLHQGDMWEALRKFRNDHEKFKEICGAENCSNEDDKDIYKFFNKYYTLPDDSGPDKAAPENRPV